MDKQLLNEFGEKLKQEKTSLEQELARFARKNPKVEGDWNAQYPSESEIGRGSLDQLDQEENADVVEEYATRVSREETLETRLQQINEALARIEEGAYGQCAECGQEIAEERLKTTPETALCAECATKQSQ